MIQASTPFHRSATGLAVCLFLSACGGGDASPPGDTTPPTLTVTDNVAAAVATGPVTFTFTFSENVGASFVADDVTATGGTKGVFVMAGDGLSATLVVTPAANASGSIEVSVPAGKFTDLSGNASTAGATVSQAYNTVVAPAPAAPGSTGTCTTTASQNCITFSEATLAFEAFEGLDSATVANDPAEAANKVAKLVKVPSGQPWAGATLFTTAANKSVPAAGFGTSKIVTLRVYSPAAGKKIRLKWEDANDNTKTLEVDATTLTTKANAWETLTFDFSTPAAGTAAFNSATTYNKVSVFPDFLTAATGSDSYYFDELKYAAAATGGGDGGVSGAGTPLIGGKFASNYAATATAWKSTENGDAGIYIDTSVPTQYWWNGVAPGDATPSFYFGYGTRKTAKPWGFGAFVKAPANGTANVASYSNVRISVWGNDELVNTKPTFTVILKGPTAGACTPELKSSLTVAANGVQTYTLPLSAFTLQTACSFTTVAQALAAGVNEVHIQVLGDNLQYVAGGNAEGDYPNGLNVGPITFN